MVKTLEARTIIAFDVAGGGCSVALWREGAVVAQRDEAMRRGQAERLLPMIEAAMSDAKLTYAMLDAIAVTVGPGGFTGVRLGLATARGLALARDLPIIPISNFMAVAAATAPDARAGRTLAVLIDAKRADLYAQAFAPDLQAVRKPAALAPEELDAYLPPGPLLLAGDAVEQALPALRDARRDSDVAETRGRADAGVVSRLAAHEPLPERGAPPPRPLYLRAPDVSVPRRANDGEFRR